MWFLIRVLRDGRRRDACVFAVAAAAATYAHFYAALVLIAAAGATMSALAAQRQGGEDPTSHLKTLFLGELIAFALVGPYLLAALVHVWTSQQGSRLWLTSLGAPGVRAAVVAARTYADDQLHAVVPVVAPGTLADWTVTVSFVCLAIVFAAGVIAAHVDEPKWLRVHIGAAVLLPPAVVFAASHIRPVYHPRYLLAITPALVLLCVRVRSVRFRETLLGCVIGVAVWVGPRYHLWLENPNYRTAAAVIAARCAPGDTVRGAAIHRRPILFYLRRVGAGCDAYENLPAPRMAGRGGMPVESRPTRSEERRTFLVDQTESGTAAEADDSPSSTVPSLLLRASKGSPFLNVWLYDR
jgi:hypothetical protein